MKRPALATLALSLLALLFGWETRQALRATPGVQDNAATAQVGSWQPGVSAPDPHSPPDPTPASSAVAARPLFRPDRQPFREEAGGASARNYEAELSRYALLGVLAVGDAPYGVVVGMGGQKGERWEVKGGDSLQGFTVKEVEVEGLRLTADGREFLLPLYAGAPTAAGGAVRTETTRRNAAQATPAARAGTPAFVSGAPSASRAGTPAFVSGDPSASRAAAPPGPAAPSASALGSRRRRTPTLPMAPGVSRSPFPSDTNPVVAPSDTPGGR
ncbi:MAG: hypothetical protein ACXWWT_12780 [Candidatus Deferrimicrobiaceae bacterium]